jgi:hypothetical protein
LTLYESVIEDPVARVTKVTNKPTKKWYVPPLEKCLSMAIQSAEKT